MTYDEIETTVNDLVAIPMEDYLKIVLLSAQTRFKSLKGKTSRASYMHEISVVCGRYLRVLRK